MYVQQMYLYRWYQDCFIEFHCLSIINFIFILVRRVLCDRFYPSRSRTVSQIVSYIHFLRSKYPWIEPFRRSKPGPTFSFARAITNIICIQYNVYIYIIADVIVYYKERKIEKKKERKYIAVKKKEKKKKKQCGMFLDCETHKNSYFFGIRTHHWYWRTLDAYSKKNVPLNYKKKRKKKYTILIV